MQSIARDSEDSTDDEFFDAHGKIHFKSNAAAFKNIITQNNSRQFYILPDVFSIHQKMFSLEVDSR